MHAWFDRPAHTVCCIARAGGHISAAGTLRIGDDLLGGSAELHPHQGICVKKLRNQGLAARQGNSMQAQNVAGHLEMHKIGSLELAIPPLPVQCQLL
jgi:hypothetical protein